MTKARDLGDFISDGTIAETVTADGLDLGDNERIRLGDSQDLQILHNGLHSYIADSGTGNLYIQTTAGLIVQNSAGTETLATFTENSSVDLYYDNSVKVATSSTGATVTGTIAVSDSFNATSGTFTVQSNGTDILNLTSTVMSPQTDGAISLGSSSNGFNELYLDGTAKVGGSILQGTDTTVVYYNSVNTYTASTVIKTSATNELTDLVLTNGDNNFGSALDFARTNSASNDVRYAALAGVADSNTAGSEAGYLKFSTKDAADSNIQEHLRIASTGAFGLSGANYGTAGQVLTSGGSGAAPTWANAGGGGVFDMTATGAISAGDLVALNTDGTVSVITETTVDSNPPTAINNTTAYSSTGNKFMMSYDTQYDKFVCVFTQSGNAKVFPATVSGTTSNATVTVGSDLTIMSKNTNEGPQVVYDSVGGKHIMAWSHYENDSDDGAHAVVLDASGTTITAGSTYDWLPGLRSDQFSLCYDADNQNIYISYKSDGGGTHVKAGSISGNTITFGSAVQISSSQLFSTCAYDPDTNQVIVVYYDSTQTETRTVFLTVSGTTLTLQTLSTSNNLKNSSNQNINTVYHYAMYEPYNNKLLISYYNQTNGGVYVSAGTVTSNSISWGTPFQVSTTNPDSLGATGTQMTLRGTTTGEFITAFRHPTSPSVRINVLSLSGTTVSFKVSNYYERTATNGGAILYNPDIPGVLLFGNQYSGTLRVQTVALTSASSNNTDFIGIASDAISNGASGEIKLLGNVDNQQSGLTPGTVYYAQSDGSLGTSDVTAKVGTALTSTAILITRPD